MLTEPEDVRVGAQAVGVRAISGHTGTMIRAARRMAAPTAAAGSGRWPHRAEGALEAGAWGGLVPGEGWYAS